MLAKKWVQVVGIIGIGIVAVVTIILIYKFFYPVHYITLPAKRLF